MKGITLFADILSVIVLLAIIMFMSLIVWSYIILHQVYVNFGIATPRTVELTLFYLPVKYDTTMLAFLEFEYNGIPMKKILEAAAIQESTNIWLEGKEIDVATASGNFLSSRIDKPFILKIVLPHKEIKIIENEIKSSISKPTSVQEASTKLFLLNGEVAELQLIVASSTSISHPCAPNCIGKQCGNDGCGGSCGTCTDGKTCNNSGICVPECAEVGLNCITNENCCSGLVCSSNKCVSTGLVEMWHGERALWQITDLFIESLDARVPSYTLFHRDPSASTYVANLKPIPEGLKFKINLSFAVVRPVHEYGTAGECDYQVITDIRPDESQIPPEIDNPLLAYRWSVGDSVCSNYTQDFTYDSNVKMTHNWSPHPYFDEAYYVCTPWNMKVYWPYIVMPKRNIWDEKNFTLFVLDRWHHNPELVSHPELPFNTWDDWVELTIPIGEPLS